MRLHQSHIKGESKPFQWAKSRNIKLGPISKREPTWAMVKYSTYTLSKIDPWSERSVMVQWRTERPPEAGRPAPRRPPGPRR